MSRNTIMSVPTIDRAMSPFGKLFDDPFFGIIPFGPADIAPSVPRMALDVKETEGGYVIEADVPGAVKDDISISLEDDVMTIAYEKAEEEKEEKDGYIVRERKSHVAIKRAVAVPGVDEESAKATMDNGVLKIEISKAAPVETKKTIEIS